MREQSPIRHFKGLIRPLKGLIRPFKGLIRPLKGLNLVVVDRGRLGPTN